MSYCSRFGEINSNLFLIRHFITTQLSIQHGAFLNETDHIKYRQLFKKLNENITDFKKRYEIGFSMRMNRKRWIVYRL